MDQHVQDKVWDYWQTTGKQEFASNVGRLDYVAKQVTKVNKHEILTIGVGDLYLEEKLLKKGLKLSLLDPSVATVKSSRDLLGLDEIRAKVGYSQNMPFEDGSFDAIIMSEVLEHLSDDVLAQTIKEAYRVLRHGGHFIITVPFDEDLKFVMCPHCDSVFHRVGHVRSFDKLSIRKTINQVFDDNKIKVWVKFLPTWGILNIRGKFVAVLRKLLELCGTYTSKSNLIVIATK